MQSAIGCYCEQLVLFLSLKGTSTFTTYFTWRPFWVPRYWKLLLCVPWTRFQTHQMEAWGPNSIVVDQHGHRVTKVHWGEEREWRGGESTRLPPMWPGIDSQIRRHIWGWVCWFSTLHREVFLRVLRFSPPQKPIIAPGSKDFMVIYYSPPNSAHKLHSSILTIWSFLSVQGLPWHTPVVSSYEVKGCNMGRAHSESFRCHWRDARED